VFVILNCASHLLSSEASETQEQSCGQALFLGRPPNGVSSFIGHWRHDARVPTFYEAQRGLFSPD
jgi:hypothetical protein